MEFLKNWLAILFIMGVVAAIFGAGVATVHILAVWLPNPLPFIIVTLLAVSLFFAFIVTADSDKYL